MRPSSSASSKADAQTTPRMQPGRRTPQHCRSHRIRNSQHRLSIIAIL